jgi:ABC-type transporter Mla subunit MlaD
MFFNHRHEQHTIALLQSIRKEIRKMNQAEQAAFAAASEKTDALVAAVVSLSASVKSEKAALDAALANADDTAGVVAAATALSAKLDAGLAQAQAALAPIVPPVPPVDPAPAA